VLVQDDAHYDDARRAWNLAVDQYPAVIVVAASASDIVKAVRFAREENLGIAIQSTGHGVVRPANDGLLIITSRMNNVHIDADAQTAWVDAGVKWGAVLERAQAFGLAPLLGSSPDVGVVGYTLGGGMGWLARKYGMAADSVLVFEMVTADGRLVRASANDNSDLYWALRGGGGGSFGIVTGMEIKLYPVSTVFGGNLIYPANMAKAVMMRYRDWIANAPDELTSSIVLMNFPPIPAVPEFLRGKSAVIVRGCYVGPVEEGEALIQPWLDWQAPLANMWRAMPFAEVATISNDPEDPMPGMATGGWMRVLSDAAIDTLIKYGVSVNGSSPLAVTEVRHTGGAVARVDKHANAFGNRDASLVLSLIGATPTPDARERMESHTQAMKDELRTAMTGGAYLNFLDGKEAADRTQDAYLPESYQRLMAVKASYDPENLFRYGFNIPPSNSN
jgi:FAD/FMN-containing dehydrogenase